MPPVTMKDLCDFMSDVAVTNATSLCQRFEELVGRHSIQLNSERVLKIFAFMNFTFVQGVWSNLQDTQLRRDLQVELRSSVAIRLARQLSGEACAEDIAAKAVFLTDDLTSYTLQYTARLKVVGYADSGTARLFALERIQEACALNDDILDDVVPSFLSDRDLNSVVESAAMQLNKAFAETKPKGFVRRLFGL